MKLIELKNKIDEILENTPEWANVERIGIVIDTKEETNFKEMIWLEDFRTICCDGQGMVAFELVMEE